MSQKILLFLSLLINIVVFSQETDTLQTAQENPDTSIFKGGFQEYGFRRCIFSNCNFTEAQWKNLYLLANQFLDCNFSDFTIYNAGIRGFKSNTNLENIKDIFTNSDVQGLIKLK